MPPQLNLEAQTTLQAKWGAIWILYSVLTISDLGILGQKSVLVGPALNPFVVERRRIRFR
jgi:hypothetical protein